MSKKFSKKEAIRFGWQTTKKNIKFFVLFLFFGYGVILGTSLIANLIEKKNFVASLPLGIFSLLSSLILNICFIKISLDFYEQKKTRILESCLGQDWFLLFKYLFGFILFLLIVFVGVIVFLIPGIIFAIRLSFWDCLIIDKKINVFEIFKKSWYLTQENFFNLLIFYILCYLIEFLGILALLVGLFWALPTIFLAKIFVYKNLLAFKNKET